MQKVLVTDASGETRVLAFVRRTEKVVYVCAEQHFLSAQKGYDDQVVGFPSDDVKEMENA